MENKKMNLKSRSLKTKRPFVKYKTGTNFN